MTGVQTCALPISSSVVLSKPMQVHGLNTYTISSDFISWGDNHNHSISEIATDFGQRTTGVGDKVFICGDDKISVFDFGLLFTVFTAMASAQAELGARFSVFEAETSRDEVKALWVGNDLIIYSPSNNLILPIDNADMERACGGVRLECSNFCTTDRYLVDRERVEIFVVEASKRELFCRLRICDHTQKYYAKHFTAPEEAKVDTFAAWDTRSALGRIIASTDHSLPTKSIFEKYRKKGLATVVDRRDELFVHPEKRYDGMETAQDLRKFAGSLCYTDKRLWKVWRSRRSPSLTSGRTLRCSPTGASSSMTTRSWTRTSSGAAAGSCISTAISLLAMPARLCWSSFPISRSTATSWPPAPRRRAWEELRQNTTICAL